MDPTTIETTENTKQLYIDFRDDSVRCLKVIRKYIHKKELEKISTQEDILKDFFVLEGYIKQLAGKIVIHSKAITTSIKAEIFKQGTSQEKIPELLKKFQEIDRSLATLEYHTSVGMQTSDALRHLARNTRNFVIGTWRETAKRIEEIKSNQQLLEQQAKEVKKQQDLRRQQQPPPHEMQEKMPEGYEKEIKEWAKMQQSKKPEAVGKR